MKFGIGFPAQVPGMDRADCLEFATRAEGLGFDSLWVLDRLVYDSMAPMPLLSAAAAVTSRVRLGTSILLATQHSPLVLAKELATIDRISNGRLIVGIAAGGRAVDFAAANIPMTERGSRLEETVSIMKQAWSGGAVKHHGKIFAFDVPPVGPTPVQKPHPPIYIGGRSDAAIDRAVRLADGYIPGGSGPAALRRELTRVGAAAARRGRDVASLPCSAVVYFGMGKDIGQALALVAQYLQTYYGPELKLRPARDTIYGDPELAAERLKEFAALSLDTLILVPAIRDARQVDLMARALTLADATFGASSTLR